MLPKTLETDRLVLRPYQTDDIDDVFAYASDPEWGRYLPVPRPYLYEHAQQFIDAQLELDWTTHPMWAITLHGKAVGGINLRLHSANRLAEMGYSIGRSCWGRGYMTEAVTAVINLAFQRDPALNRIRAMADSRNHGSLRVMAKIGMTQEGILRQNRYTFGEFIDEVWCGILRTEWESHDH